jgi:hypothetical protein
VIEVEDRYLPPRPPLGDLVTRLRAVVLEHEHVLRAYVVHWRKRIVVDGGERERERTGVFVELRGRARGRHLDAVQRDLWSAFGPRYWVSLGNHEPPREVREVALVAYERGRE